MFRYVGRNWAGRWFRTTGAITTLGHQIEHSRPGTYATDGTVADRRHDQINPDSDHSPDNDGNVRALDWGGPLDFLADTTEAIRRSRDPRTLYVIHDRRMYSSYSAHGYAPYTWRPYRGVNGHLTHAHLSVVSDHRGEQTQPWTITLEQEPPDMPFLPLKLGDGEGDRVHKRSDVAAIQAVLNRAYTLMPPLTTDGIYGEKTARAIRTHLDGDGSSFYGNLYDDLHAALVVRVASDVIVSTTHNPYSD